MHFIDIKSNIPDGEAHVMPDGKIYLYGSLDEHKRKWCSDKYKVIFSSDLEKWEESDVSFSIEDVPWAKEVHLPEFVNTAKSYEEIPASISMFIPKAAKLIPFKIFLKILKKNLISQQKNKLLYAPDCICKNGTYYLYFCLSDGSEGVAESDSPVGPFKQSVRLPISGIDPAVFVDDDGQAYYYWGQFIFITKNGYSDLVVMSSEYYERFAQINKINQAIFDAETEVENGAEPISLDNAMERLNKNI